MNVSTALPLITPRVLVREFTPADFAALRAIDADPEVLRYRSRPEITPDMTREFLAQAASSAAEGAGRARYALAVVLRGGPQAGQLIGQCGLTRLPPGTEAFLWYSLNRQHWGQGYMTEAARAVLAFGFEAAGLERIFAECHPENLASVQVMQRIGLRPEAHMPDEDEHFPERRGHYRYALQQDEWLSDN